MSYDRARFPRHLDLRLSLMLSILIAGSGTYYALAQRPVPAVPRQQSAPQSAQASTIHSYTGQPETWTALTQDADLVVEGVVERLLPARWTTLDGTAPTTPQHNDPTVHIRTPVRFTVTRVFKGQRVPPSVIFSIPGGQVGAAALASEETEIYNPGTHLLVFLYRGQASSPPAQIDSGALFPSMPLVIEGDVAHGPIKDVPVADLVQQIHAGLE